MTEQILCLDSSVLVKYLLVEEPEELTQAARNLVLRAIANGRLVAPSWAWAEVGSVLRKKVRGGQLRVLQADELFAEFQQLGISFVDTLTLRRRAWEIAQNFGLPTLYDATFLACTEVVPAAETSTREFWTADRELLRQLGANRPTYVHFLTSS